MKLFAKGYGSPSIMRRLLPAASLIVVAIGACAPPVFQPGDSFEGEILIEAVDGSLRSTSSAGPPAA